MTRLGYLVRSPDGHYRLGPAAFTLAMAALSNRELPEMARPFLEDLAATSGETALLATMAGDAPAAVYIDKVESQNTVRYMARIGERRPLYCSAIGKLLLAYLPPVKRQEYLKTTRLKALTPKTPVTARVTPVSRAMTGPSRRAMKSTGTARTWSRYWTGRRR